MNKETIWVHCPVCGNIKGLKRKTQNGRENHVVGKAGKKVRRILDEKGWNLSGVLNMHSNADHIGGNQYLQQQTGCKVYSSGIEKAFTEYPILEPSFLYGGYPCKTVKSFLLFLKIIYCRGRAYKRLLWINGRK